MKKVAFHTLGCKLNFSETSTIARQFEHSGWERVHFNDVADVYIINTCSVTENADRECRSIVNKARSKNPVSSIVITGCYAQLKPEEINSLPGVDYVVGANDKFNILRIIEEQSINARGTYSCNIDDVNSFHSSYSSGDRTRAFLKIQDGCDYTCTFCTIPQARGKSRSASIDKVIEQANEIASKGIVEIVLTGVNTGDFGLDPLSGSRVNRLMDLLPELEKVNGIERYRISSIEPNLLDDSIIEWVAQSHKFLPHFHIPMQSGSDEMLKKMRRRYLTSLYQRKIEKIKALMPDAGIGADVITGFPGETDDHFNETSDFIKSLGLSYLHVFTYSERDNTPASTMSLSVPHSVRKERTHHLRNLSERMHRQFMMHQIGTKQQILFESAVNDGFMFGYTPNYCKVGLPYDKEIINKPTEVLINGYNADGYLEGMLIEDNIKLTNEYVSNPF